jgi:hypothetical protein
MLSKMEVPIAPGLGLYLDEVFFENYNNNQVKLAVLHDEKIASNAAAKTAIVKPTLDGDAIASTDGTVTAADADNETEPVCTVVIDSLPSLLFYTQTHNTHQFNVKN